MPSIKAIASRISERSWFDYIGYSELPKVIKPWRIGLLNTRALAIGIDSGANVHTIIECVYVCVETAESVDRARHFNTTK